MQQYPSQSIFWPFIQCQGYGDLKNIGNEDLAKECAKVVGVDWDPVNTCINGG